MTLLGFLLLGLLGAGVGFLAGLLGIGGGMVLTPFLTMLLSAYAIVPNQILVHVAIATSMSTIVLTSLSSLITHAKAGGVSWPAFWRLMPGILIGGFIGARISSMLPTFWLACVFSAFVFFSAYKMLTKKKTSKTEEPTTVVTLPSTWLLVGMGLLIGTVAALLGAGGGFLTVPLLTLLGVPIIISIGTSAALGFPVAVSGTLGYIVSGWHLEESLPFPEMIGYIYIPALVAVVSLSVMTAPLGAKTAHAMDTNRLRRLFACLLLALGAYMLYKGYLAR